MGDYCSQVPCSGLLLLFLLLLPLPLFRALHSGWKNFYTYHLPHVTFHVDKDLEMRHNQVEDEKVLEYCDGVFDVYYIVEK
jgi:hypothetical protein